MDSARFGRALGIGARSAAKALAGAVDAATAPNPNQPSRPSIPSQPYPETSRPETSRPAISRPVASATRTAAAQAATVSKNLTRGRKRFGEAFWGPFARLSRVLWLEITGSFFGIFAVFAGSAVWTHRTEFRSDLHSTPANHDARLHLFVFFAMTLVFGYFCISSFVRAYRR